MADDDDAIPGNFIDNRTEEEFWDSVGSESSVAGRMKNDMKSCKLVKTEARGEDILIITEQKCPNLMIHDDPKTDYLDMFCMECGVCSRVVRVGGVDDAPKAIELSDLDEFLSLSGTQVNSGNEFSGELDRETLGSSDDDDDLSWD